MGSIDGIYSVNVQISCCPHYTAFGVFDKAACFETVLGLRLEIVVDTSITAKRVVRTLEQLKAQHGTPEAIRVDNGPEMTAQVFADWCSENNVEIKYIQPGKPNQNAYIERFNRSFREEVLDPHIFSTISQVRDISWAWLLSYNEERPHSSLGNIPPAEFKRRLLAENSSLDLCP